MPRVLPFFLTLLVSLITGAFSAGGDRQLGSLGPANLNRADELANTVQRIQGADGTFTEVTCTGPDPEDALTTANAYDELDYLATVTETGLNGTTVVDRPRNHAGDVLSETVTIGGNIQSLVSQKVNGAGRRFERSTADFIQSFAHRADGLMTSTTVGSRVYSSGFTTAGLFISRSGPFQSQSIGHDNSGRMDSRSTTVGGVQALVETTPAVGNSPGRSAVDKINRLQITRSGGGAWSELREFHYDASYRLTGETYLPSPSASANDTDLFFYDSPTHNTTGGPGVMVGRKRTSDGLEWKNSTIPGSTAFARITTSTHKGRARIVPLSGIAFGAQSVELEIDGRQIHPVNFPGWEDPVGAWSASVPLPEGVHNLTARAVHPSSWIAPATSQFTLAPRVNTLTVAHDEVGNVISRSWTGGPSQTLTWDPVGRLVKVVQTGVNPFIWTALYDGLNRRIRTTYTPQGGDTVTIRQVYDPDVEFLCIGEGVSTGSGAIGWSWKAYGIDRSGKFGGLEGLGGLEAIRDASGKWRGIVSDWWGNTTGWVEKNGATITWSTAQFGAFGGLAGWNTAVQDGSTPLHQLLGYHGLTTDPPGFLQMGLRPYDPHEGTWLAPDPLGHAASISLYDYCDNDPVNLADPDGRFGKSVSRGAATFLTGYSGPSGLSGSQIWTSYTWSSAGQLHSRQLDSFLNWVPGVNTVKWSGEAISGRNLFTGADLTVGQQIGSAFGVAATVLPASIGAWASSATKIGTGSTFSNPAVVGRGFQNTAANPWGSATPSVGTMNSGGTTAFNYSFQAAKNAPGKFTVGIYDDIRGTVPGLDAHHVGQKAVMGKLIPGYDPATAPAILVPKIGHTRVGPTGRVSTSTEGFTNPRDVIARDIWEMRRVYPDAPNSQLQKLIQMNKDMYPSINK